MKFSTFLPLALDIFGLADAQTCKTNTFMVVAEPAKDLTTYMLQLSYDKAGVYIGNIKWSSPTSEPLLLTYPTGTSGSARFFSYHSQMYYFDLTIDSENVAPVSFWSGNIPPPGTQTREGYTVDAQNIFRWKNLNRWFACPEPTIANTYKLWFMGGNNPKIPAGCVAVKLKAYPYGQLAQ
ncbi:hypothetical protein RUND412_000792 [Rhizina undulata]